jgi:hypothetical protein
MPSPRPGRLIKTCVEYDWHFLGTWVLVFQFHHKHLRYEKKLMLGLLLEDSLIDPTASRLCPRPAFLLMSFDCQQIG